MKVLTFRKIVIIVLEFIITEIISFIIQLNIPTDNLTNIKMKTFIDNAIIIGTIFIILFIVIQIIYWYITNLNKKINELSFINKFNTIMLIKFENQYKAHSCQVFDYDIVLFNKKEKIYLDKFIKKKEELKVQMKGKNTVQGIF